MFAARLLPSVALLALAAPALASVQRPLLIAQELREYQAVSRFSRAVDDYVWMHRIVEPLPPETMCLPDGTIATVNDTAATPLDARPSAREGDIFAVEIAEVFRDRIANAVRRHDINVWDLVSEMNEEEIIAPPVAAGAALPMGVGERPIPWLVDALPALPEGLEYRLAGRDLVLLDTHANRVVDVLRVAVPMY